MMANEILKLAYDSVLIALSQQDATLASLRNRTTGLLAVSAVATSISASVGLSKAEPGAASSLPHWAAWFLLALTICIGAAVMFILFPAAEWSFGVAPAQLLASENLSIDDVHRQATTAMIVAVDRNKEILDRRILAFRWGVAGLFAQIVILIVGVVLL